MSISFCLMKQMLFSGIIYVLIPTILVGWLVTLIRGEL